MHAGRMLRYLTQDKWRGRYLVLHKCWCVLSFVAIATVTAVAYVQQWSTDMGLNVVMCIAYVVHTVLWLLGARLELLGDRRDMIVQRVLVVE